MWLMVLVIHLSLLSAELAWPTDSQMYSIKSTIYHIYTLLPADGGLLICLKYVVV
jgi:hypothetical protein